jgi:hypothetical protein
MKRYFLFVFVLVLSRIVPAYALDTVRVNIPFDFRAGGATLPAGEYTIAMSGQQGGIVIQGLDGQGGVFDFTTYARRFAIPEVLTRWAPGASTGHESDSTQSLPRTRGSLENCVVFLRYGDQYFISQVWTGLSGREFYQTEREIRTARIPLNRETVVLAAVIR